MRRLVACGRGLTTGTRWVPDGDRPRLRAQPTPWPRPTARCPPTSVTTTAPSTPSTLQAHGLERGRPLERGRTLAVSAAVPPTTGRSDARARFLEDLERLPFPFSEDADPTHVTASAIVVGSRGTVLHVHRRTGAWLQPGGHIDPGEAPPDAALRETVEETGLAVRHPDAGPCLIHVDVHDAPRGHVHLDLRYLLLAPDDDPAPAPGESQEARWFSWDEADAVADESLRNALRAACGHA